MFARSILYRLCWYSVFLFFQLWWYRIWRYDPDSAWQIEGDWKPRWGGWLSWCGFIETLLCCVVLLWFWTQATTASKNPSKMQTGSRRSQQKTPFLTCISYHHIVRSFTYNLWAWEVGDREDPTENPFDKAGFFLGIQIFLALKFSCFFSGQSRAAASESPAEDAWGHDAQAFQSQRFREIRRKTPGEKPSGSSRRPELAFEKMSERCSEISVLNRQTSSECTRPVQ